MSGIDIAVVGASGVVGRRVCEALVGTRFVTVARDQPLPAARVVINAAGPLRETAAPILVAAMTAGAHYLDVGGEQAVMKSLYERHESTVRRAGLVALPGAGLDCVLGDLAAAWAAAHVCDVHDDGDAVRGAPAARVGEDRPLDEIAVSYVFDDLVLSAGSQRALFGQIGERALVWRRDRWESGRTADARRVNAGTELGGERDAVAHAGGDAMTIPRHVAANLVTTYLSTTRRRATGLLMRLAAAAIPLVPRTASELLAASPPDESELSRARFAVVAQVRRGFSAAQVAVRGEDPYRTTAAIAAWCARALAARGAGPVGMRAPGELFRPAPALRSLAEAAGLVIEPSFGTP